MSNVIIPSSPADVKRIKDCIIEISNAMTLIQAQKDFIKEAVESCCEDVEIDKKLVLDMMGQGKRIIPEIQDAFNGIFKLAIWSLIAAVILTIYLSESGAIQ